MNEKYVHVVSVNGVPRMIFANRKDAIEWCSEIWSENVSYRLNKVELRENNQG